jgi:hypothetical protein
MAVEQHTFTKNVTLAAAAERAKKSNGRFHFLGLVIDNNIQLKSFVFFFFEPL